MRKKQVRICFLHKNVIHTMIIVFLLYKNMKPNKYINILQSKRQVCQKSCQLVIWLTSCHIRYSQKWNTQVCTFSNGLFFWQNIQKSECFTTTSIPPTYEKQTGQFAIIYQKHLVPASAPRLV